MALIRCPECKKNISDSVSACLHCGRQFAEGELEIIKAKNTRQEQQALLGCAGTVVGIVLFLIIGSLLIPEGSNNGNQYKSKDQRMLEGYHAEGKFRGYTSGEELREDIQALDEARKLLEKEGY